MLVRGAPVWERREALETMNRRLKIHFSPEDVACVFIGGHWCRSSCPYPADTKIVESHWNAERRSVVLTLEHPTFPAVPAGEEPLLWFRVEEKTSEAPRFGFFLRREWKASEERDQELAAAEAASKETP